MIPRRTLLQSGAAMALGAPALVGFAQQSVTLKFHTFMAPQSNVWLDMHKPWMAKVEKEGEGCNQEECERGEKGDSPNGFKLVFLKDMIE